MKPEKAPETVLYLDRFTSRKEEASSGGGFESVPDSLVAWMNRYLQLVIQGVRSEAVTKKIALHLDRFAQFFANAYGHDRISTCLRRDVAALQAALVAGDMAPATVNNHLASLSGFTTWVHAQAPALFAAGDPTKGIGDLGLPPLEPRALSEDQVRSLKSV